jgi:hypothetical protein
MSGPSHSDHAAFPASPGFPVSPGSDASAFGAISSGTPGDGGPGGVAANAGPGPTGGPLLSYAGDCLRTRLSPSDDLRTRLRGLIESSPPALPPHPAQARAGFGQAGSNTIERPPTPRIGGLPPQAFGPLGVAAMVALTLLVVPTAASPAAEAVAHDDAPLQWRTPAPGRAEWIRVAGASDAAVAAPGLPPAAVCGDFVLIGAAALTLAGRPGRTYAYRVGNGDCELRLHIIELRDSDRLDDLFGSEFADVTAVEVPGAGTPARVAHEPGGARCVAWENPADGAGTRPRTACLLVLHSNEMPGADPLAVAAAFHDAPAGGLPIGVDSH